MNAVEIEEAVSELAGHPFDPAEFAYAFLTAFGNKDTTIKRLRSGQSNASDIKSGVLQRNNIHIAVCADGLVTRTLVELRESPKTGSAKAKFVLATDGVTLEAEDLNSGETIACVYQDFAQYFGFFLPLAGISTIKEIKNNPFDVKATGRLNKLYVELLKDNPDWATEEKRPALNQFIARLIFCFFAEDTSIFQPKQFTRIIEQMSDGQSGNTHEVLAELFRSMDTKPQERAAVNIKNWANVFPYVNGGMFTGATDCPRFNRIARSYLLAIGNLEWDKINPDIFGSMIQAVADDDERGALGMHYTSVPNILKVLNPLFLDDLREQLAAGEDNIRKLRNLRKRLASIRVFDPACGSGNFLVIAYKEMRAIEHQIVVRTKDNPKSWIKLDNFYGIEIKNFAVEIARLALLIAEFQCDVRFINQQEARAMVLPLHRTGQIRVGNALKLDWLEVCPPESRSVAVEHDLAGPTGRLALEEDALQSAPEPETYICGNPPYKGSQTQTVEQKADLAGAFERYGEAAKQIDYVGGWFLKAAELSSKIPARTAFVSTNSICQGRIVPILWPILFKLGQQIAFAYTSFKWANLASHNAGVTVVVVGMESTPRQQRMLFSTDSDDTIISRTVSRISPYLVATEADFVEARSRPVSDLPTMNFGNMPVDGGHLLMERGDVDRLGLSTDQRKKFIKRIYGSAEFIRGGERYCIWVNEDDVDGAVKIDAIASRIDQVRKFRIASKDVGTKALAAHSHRFREQKTCRMVSIIVPSVSSEARQYLPVGLLDSRSVISNLAFAITDAPLWNIALIASRLHLVWVATVCGKLKTDYRYSNTLGWNTFPIPKLTEHNKSDLNSCAEDILLSREANYPKTIAELYDPENMPDDLRRAHEVNDETLERIYIGRRFRNDTERLEKLFELYAKMTADQPQPKKKAKRAA